MADFILGRLKFKWKGDWVTGTAYIIDDIIKYGANTYVCVVNHTADAAFYTDLDSNSYWSLHTESFSYNTTTPAWQAGTAYKLNDVVRWGSNLYICKTHHTSDADANSGFVTDNAKWVLFVPGLEFEDSYINSKQYQTGDVVTYGGYTYTAKQDTKENLPTDTANWEIVTTGFTVMGDYNSGTAYKPGSVIRRNGYTYVANADTTGNSPTVQDGDSSSPTYNQTIVNSTYWDQLNSGFKFIGDWADSVTYYLGDVVKETNSSYVCKDEHLGDGSATTKPPNTTFWETLSAGDTQIVMNSPGDIMIRTSTNVALNVGQKGWKLRADEGQGHPVHWDPDDESYTWYVDAHKGEDEENLTYSPGVTSTGAMTSNEQTLCTRDLGYVLNASKYDMAIGTNYMQTIVGHRMQYGVSVTTADRIRVLGAINHAKLATVDINSVKTVNSILTDVTNGFNEVTDIINNGHAAANPVTLPAFGATQNKQNAVAQMQANKNFIAAEVNAWVEDYISAMTQAEQDLCTRDLGYVVDAAKNDMAIGSNYMAVITGIRMNYSLYATSSDIVRVQDAIDHSETAVKALANVTGAAETAVVAAYAEIKDIMDNGLSSANALTFPDFNTGRSDWTDRKNGGDQLQANKDFIAADVNAWVTQNYASHFSTYDEAKCTRDSGYIVDALTYDLMYGGDTAMTIMAKSFFDGGVSQLTTPTERNVTVLAYDHLASIASDIVQETTVTPQTGNTETQDILGTPATAAEGTICSSLVQIIEDAITANSAAGIPAPTAVDVATSTYITAHTEVTTDQTTIISAAVASVAGSASYVHDATKCTRDTKYFVDAMCYDLMYGGDFGTIISANSFFDGGASQIPANHRVVTGLAYNYMADVFKYCIEENTSWNPEQSAVTQDTSGTAGTSAETTIVDTNLQVIEDAVKNNTSVGTAITYPAITNASANATTAFNDITSSQATIISNAVASQASGSSSSGVAVQDYSSTATYLPGQVTRWAPPAWQSGGTYTIGEIVSHVDTAPTPATMDWYKCKDTTNADTVAPMTNAVAGAPWVKISPSAPIAQTTAQNPSNTVHIYYGKDRLYGKDDSTTSANYNSSAVKYKVYMAIKERVGVEPANAESGAINEGWREVLNGVKVDSDNQVTGVITWGKNPSAAFKTIRYACARARTGDQIKCAPGVFKEFLPITIPAGVGIFGTEMRTTFIEPNMEDDGGNGVGISMLGSGIANNECAMFYCNDAITVRGFTFRGLGGTVIGVGNPHTEPTIKGVCFQLDPNGEVNLKSPFIQNCCSINDGGGGIYCDGTHAPNGRYASFCTNDFTQINSNGFGLFATNKGRIEAVSVFTYYCHVGYATTHGGIIRSANGNNSYGNYGSISEGHYASEAILTQKTGQIDNRTGESVPYRVVVNESTGQVQRIEWSYAGENYSNATVSFTAAGDNDAGTTAAGGAATFTAAHVNGGINRIDMINNVSNLNRYTGNAQGGTNPTSGDATLTLTATANTIADDAINGMVCNLLSGTGGGQYAIVKDYDNASKVATLDGQWISMTGSATAVPDTTSVYEIEPAVTLSGGSAPTDAAFIRCQVSSLSDIEQLLIVNPGSGYDASNPPTTVTITDPLITLGSQAVNSTIRIKNGVPVWTRTSGGGGYPTGMTSGATTPGTTVAIVSGDGFAEVPQTGSYLEVTGLQREPKDGSNLEIAGDPTYYQVVNTIGYVNSGGSNGTGRVQISPSMVASKAPVHNSSIQFREEYSSCRLTGHDFLDVGTGTFVTSNYPGTPTQPSNPTNETQGHCGGRVFFTSTDQDGNFSVGGLFSVQQATGTATLNAEQFSLNGLQQLKLGALQFAGYGATIDEFSTDGTLSGNSDNALVTEKAIKTYITNQLGGGENALEVNTATIGTVDISGNTISTTTESTNNLNLKAASGKVTFDTTEGEPQYAGTVTTENTLISRGYFEDNFVTQQLIAGIMSTLDNDRVAGTGDPNTP